MMLTELPDKPKIADQPTPGQREEKWLIKGVDYLIDQYEARQNEIARDTGESNHGVHEPRLAAGTTNFTAVPCCMFFYYVRVDNDGRLRVAHYRYVDGDPNDRTTWQPIEYSEERLKPLVESLARNARPSGAKDPPPDTSENFQDIVWECKSYIAIFIDEAHWKLHKFPAEDAAVVFITERKNGKTGTVNHSFFDAMDFEIDMPIAGGPATDQRSAIVFVNHMKKDEQGTDLGEDENGNYVGVEEEFFQFKMFLDVAFASGHGVPMTVIFDPGGTNLGPPVPPPA